MKKTLVAVVVLMIAGVTGSALSTTSAAEYVRNPYYRDALTLEAEFEFIDILQFKTNDKDEIVMGVMFVEEATQEDFVNFTERLGDVFQKHTNEDTPFVAVWVVVLGRDGRFYASGLFKVTIEDLLAEGVTENTLRPSQAVYFRWVTGTPLTFAEGTWPWIGR